MNTLLLLVALTAREPVVAEVPKAVPYTFQFDDSDGIEIILDISCKYAEATTEQQRKEGWAKGSDYNVILSDELAKEWRCCFTQRHSWFHDSQPNDFDGIEPHISMHVSQEDVKAGKENVVDSIWILFAQPGHEYRGTFLLHRKKAAPKADRDAAMKLISKDPKAFYVEEIKDES